jgi:glycine/D-amino acid oxidase-like deaminating enzyme/nitrite reductase/ring-hydroxylating ferredoxin subunit
MPSTNGHTRSIWMEARSVRGPPLDASIGTDVCVIGAGIAGLTSAYLLTRAGYRVVVLDAGDIGGGETGRTTAHLSNALDDRYSELERVHGLDGSRLAAASHTAAIDRIEAIVQEGGIDCAFSRLDGYLARHPDDEADVLQKELDAARRAGLTAVTMVERSPVPTFSEGPVLKLPAQAQFHPLRYLDGLARAIRTGGGQIYTHSPVRSIDDGATVTVTATSGRTVTAKAAVVATNSPISDKLAIHTKQAPYRTYAIALAVPADSVPQALYWDSGDPYHYVRTCSASDGTLTLIVGGEDHKTGQADDAERRFASLAAWARKHFPMVGEIRYRWSGQVMEPVDHLAFIGRDIGSRNVYLATGDSGHGMTHGTIAGMLITDLVGGQPNPWAELYSPERKSAKTVGTFAKENLNVARQFTDYLKPGEVADPAQIAPGSGALVRKGTHLLAVHRDADGALHACSAVCTHAGCIVHWNSTEISWDCPCHGSRFDTRGAPISGPALEPLAQESIGRAE